MLDSTKCSPEQAFCRVTLLSSNLTMTYKLISTLVDNFELYKETLELHTVVCDSVACVI